MPPYLIEMFWSEDDQAWLCTALDLPGCSAAGNSPVEAVRETEDAMTSWMPARTWAGICPLRWPGHRKPRDKGIAGGKSCN